MILLTAGMSWGLDSVASPFTMSASVWLSTMIFMQCVFSLCGLHSSSFPSEVRLMLSSSSDVVLLVGLVWLVVNCLSIGSLLRVVLVNVAEGVDSFSVLVVSGFGGIPSGAKYALILGLHSLIQVLLVRCVLASFIQFGPRMSIIILSYGVTWPPPLCIGLPGIFPRRYVLCVLIAFHHS